MFGFLFMIFCVYTVFVIRICMFETKNTFSLEIREAEDGAFHLHGTVVLQYRASVTGSHFYMLVT